MASHFCPSCGASLQPDAHFCAECGYQVPLDPGAGPAADQNGPAAPQPAGDRKAPGRALWILVLVLVLILGGVGLAFVLTRDKNTTSASASDAVILEPTAVQVPDPFTDSVAVDEQPIVATPEPTPTAAESSSASPSETPAPGGDATASTGAGGGVVVGSAPGLYGGTRDQAACDPERLVTFLQASPAKAKAWAAVQGIAVADIPDFVAGLTPVVLRRDTRVVNYGYRDGKANAYPAVLQAGSAVLIDAYGVPRAKCSCGNPLSEARPVTTATKYQGTKWPGFKPDQVVVIKANVKISVVILVDASGKPFGRPVGTAGASDTDGTGGTGGEDAIGPVDGPSEGTSAPKLAEVGSPAGVSNGPTAPTVVTLPAARVTAIQTYHWNNATGDTPGKISLRAAEGTVYGPFATTGLPGQGGVPNAYWLAVINYRLPAGSYTIIDSHPATWAWTPDTGGRGMATVWGVASAGSTPTPSAQPTTLAGSRSAEARQAVVSHFCAGDFRNYVDSVRSEEIAPLLYRVRVHITLDSGEWTAKFDVDFATEGGPEIRSVTTDSAELLC